MQTLNPIYEGAEMDDKTALPMLGLEPTKSNKARTNWQWLVGITFILVFVGAGAAVGGTYAAGVWGSANSNSNATIAGNAPTHKPSWVPSLTPSHSPSTSIPTSNPSTSRPSSRPSKTPSISPSVSAPSIAPSTSRPSQSPSTTPSNRPTTTRPSQNPTINPTTARPSNSPTTSRPSRSPSKAPTTARPSHSPSQTPSRSPTTSRPSKSPTTSRPTSSPTTSRPTVSPTTMSPTMNCASINYDLTLYSSGSYYSIYTSPHVFSNGVTLLQTGNNYISQDGDGVGVSDGSVTSGLPLLRDDQLNYGETLTFQFQYGAKSVQYYVGGVSSSSGGTNVVIDTYDQYGNHLGTAYTPPPGAGTWWTVSGVIKSFRLSIASSWPPLGINVQKIQFTPLSC